MSRASSLSIKEIQKKRNIKSEKIEKINKRKRKMLVSKAFHDNKYHSAITC